MSADRHHDPFDEIVPELEEDVPAVVRTLNTIFAEAMKRGAWQIHIDPDDAGVSVRMRIDGQLQEALRLPRHVYAALIGRLKNIGKLDVAERLRPQTGRVAMELEGQRVEFTVATLPLGNRDERIVLSRIV